MPATDTIEVYQGETVTLTFTMSPVEDITGWTIVFAVEGVSTTEIINVNAALSDPTNGVFTVPLARLHTLNLRLGTYSYDVWRVDAGTERPLAVGSFRVLESGGGAPPFNSEGD